MENQDELNAKLADLLYRCAVELKNVALTHPLLSVPEHANKRDTLDQICGQLQHLQAGLGFDMILAELQSKKAKQLE